MKRIISVATALILVFALCACYGGGNPGTIPTSSSPAQTTTSKPTQSQDGRGDIIDSDPDVSEYYESNDAGRGDVIGSNYYDLPYWNGFDFGPNLNYGEEYEIQGDPGEYLNAAEGAKLTFNTMKANDSIPAYSDNLQYTMTLIDLSDINGEECYVYRLDVDESSGTIGAAYAYAYQSVNIYMQGQGGQWVIQDWYGDGHYSYDESDGGQGDLFDSDPGDTDVPNWWGEFKGEEFSVGFTNFDGASFWFTFYNLRNGQSFFESVAVLYPDNEFMAEHGDISFYLYEDFSAVDLFASEGSEWAHLRGQYERID
jgi:predicted small lipoprotein YifL